VMEDDWQTAIDRWERCRIVRRRVGDVVGIALLSHNLGELRCLQGRLDDADALIHEARRIWRGASYAQGIVLGSMGLGRVRVLQGRFDDAHQLFDETLDALDRMSTTNYRAEVYTRIAEGHAYSGRWDDASAGVDHALELGDANLRPQLLRIRALTLLGRGQPSAEAFRDALSASSSDIASERAVTLAAAARCGELGAAEQQAHLAESERIAGPLGVVLPVRLPPSPWCGEPRSAPLRSRSPRRPPRRDAACWRRGQPFASTSSMRARVASIAWRVFSAIGRTSGLVRAASCEMSHVSRTRVPPSTGSSS
jgi:Tetratricopeptide repeat